MNNKDLTGYASQDKPWLNARFMIICGLPIRIILMESQSFILGIKYLLKTFFVTSSPQQKRLFQQV